MSQITFSFLIDEDLKNDFEILAKSMDSTGALLLLDYMRDMVRRSKEAKDHEAWFRAEVQTGLDAANAGEVVSAEYVEAEAAAWREEMRRRPRSVEA